MALTLEDINAIDDTTLTPELEAAILSKLEPKLPTYLTGKGFIAKPKADYDTEIAGLVTAKEKELIGNETARLYGDVDELLKTIINEAKPDNTKTKDWVKMLKEKGIIPVKKDDGSNPTDKGLIDGLKKELEDLRKGADDKEKANFARLVNQSINIDLDKAPVLYDQSGDQAAKDRSRRESIGTMRTLFHALYEGKQNDQGDLYFVKKGTDAAIMDTTTNQPMTPLQIVKRDLKAYLAPEGHQQKGGGTGSNGGGTGGDVARTEKDIFKAAAEKGLRMFSDDWNKYVKEEKAKLK